MIKAIVAAIVVYLVSDAGWDFVLEPIGLTYLHAFLAMFCGSAAAEPVSLSPRLASS